MLADETPVGSFDEWLRRRMLEMTTELEKGFCVFSNKEKIAEEEFEGRSIVCGMNRAKFIELKRGIMFTEVQSRKSFIKF